MKYNVGLVKCDVGRVYMYSSVTRNVASFDSLIFYINDGCSLYWKFGEVVYL
jgi:hypothetical protein